MIKGIHRAQSEWHFATVRLTNGLSFLWRDKNNNESIYRLLSFGDRFFNRVKQADFIVFDNTSRENELREKNWGANL